MAGCQVCFESYEENGEHLPRILPCAGLICEKCIAELLDGSSIDCPECGSKHAAKNGVKSFPQTVLPRAKRKIPEKSQDGEKCKKHGKDACINCDELYCTRAVMLFLQDHCKVKEEAEAEEEEFETLFSDLETVSRNLRSYKTKILVAKEKLEKKNAACINKMKTRKREIKKMIPKDSPLLRMLNSSFSEPIQRVTNEIEKIDVGIDKQVASIDKKLVLLDGIKEITDESATHDDIKSSMNIITRIAEQIKAEWLGIKKYNYLEYNTMGKGKLSTRRPLSTAEEVGKLIGHLTQKQLDVKFSIDDEDDTDSEFSDNEDLISFPRNRRRGRSVGAFREELIKIESSDDEEDAEGVEDPVQNETDDDSDDLEILDDPPEPFQQESSNRNAAAPTFGGSELLTVKTEHSHILHVCSLSDGSLIVCGKLSDEWRLTKYRLRSFATVHTAKLEHRPDGMTEVSLEEKRCLAVSYMKEKKIEFHDVSNLDTVLNSYLIGPLIPSRLCTLSSFPFILLYEDRSKELCEIKWLDCSSNPPKPASDTDIIHTQQELIWDMCCTQVGDKQLLVTTRGKDGITAYNIDSDKLQWSAKGKLPGMETVLNAWGLATDGYGHLFVCDFDGACIQKFSARGAYLGAVLKKGDHGFGQPWGINCYARSSLIVVHITNAQYQISKAQDALDDVDEIDDEEMDEEELSPNTSDESAEQILCEDSPPPDEDMEEDMDEDALLEEAENGIAEQETPTTQEAEIRQETQNGLEPGLPNTAVKPLKTSPVADKLPIPPQQGKEKIARSFPEVSEAEKITENEEQAAAMTLHDHDSKMTENLFPQETIVIEDDDQTPSEKSDETVGVDPRRSLEPDKIIQEEQTGNENLPEKEIHPQKIHYPETRSGTAHPFDKDLNKIPENVPTVSGSIPAGKGAVNTCPLMAEHEITPDHRHIALASEVKEQKLHGKTQQKTPESTPIAFEQTPSRKDGENMQPRPVNRGGPINSEKSRQNKETSENNQSINRQIPPSITVEKVALFDDGSERALEPGVYRQTPSDKEGENTEPNREETETSSAQHETPQINKEEVDKISKDAPVDSTNIPSGTEPEITPSLDDRKTPQNAIAICRETPSKTEEENIQPPLAYGQTPLLNSEKNTELCAENIQTLEKTQSGTKQTPSKEAPVEYITKISSENVSEIFPAGDKMENSLNKAPFIYRHIPSKKEMSHLKEKSIERNNNEKVDTDENTDENLRGRVEKEDHGMMESITEQPDVQTSDNDKTASRRHSSTERESTVEFKDREDMENWLTASSVREANQTTVEFSSREDMEIWLKDASGGETALETQAAEEIEKVPEVLPERITPVQFTMEEIRNIPLPPEPPPRRFQESQKCSDNSSGCTENAIRVPKVEHQEQEATELMSEPSDEATSPNEVSDRRGHMLPVEEHTVQIQTSEPSYEVPEAHMKIKKREDSQLGELAPQPEITSQPEIADQPEIPDQPEMEGFTGRIEDRIEKRQRPAEEREMTTQFAEVENWQRPLVGVQRETSPQVENWQRPLERDTSPQVENWQRPLESAETETSSEAENWQRPLERVERETFPQGDSWQRPLERMETETSSEVEIWQRPLEGVERETIPQFSVPNGTTVWIRDPVPGSSTQQQQTPESKDLFSIQGRILEKGDCISNVFHEADQGITDVDMRLSTKTDVDMRLSTQADVDMRLSAETDVDMRLSTHPDADILLSAKTDVDMRLSGDAAMAEEFNEGDRELTQEAFSGSDKDTRAEVLRRSDQSVSDEDLQSDDSSESFTEGPPIQGLTFMAYMSLLPDGSVVVCGKLKGWPFKREEWKMVRYNAQLDRTFSASALKPSPDGMSDVKLGGKHCIAVAYSNYRQIDFHDVNNVGQIVLTFPVAPHQPGRLCPSSQTSLLYIDYAKTPREVRWLDCSTTPPKLATVTNTMTATPGPKLTHVTQHEDIHSMCCVQYGGKHLLVVTHAIRGVSAYNTETDRLDWCVTRKVLGVEKEINASAVTADGRGHLFICDSNNSCVHMLSTDGQHLGTLQKEGHQGLGAPMRVRWSTRTASLILAHLCDDAQYRIRKIPATAEYLEKIKTKTAKKQKELAKRQSSVARRESQERLSPLNCKVTRSMITRHSHISYVTLLPDGSILFCGKDGNQWRLIQYDMYRNMELGLTRLEKRPDGIAEVVMDGELCLAVSYLSNKIIHFYDVNDPKEIVNSISVAPHRPGRLCTYSTSTLLYEDHSQTPHVLGSLDCSTSRIKQVTDSDLTKLELEGGLHDMFFLKANDNEYFVTTNGYKGLFSYSAGADGEDAEWKLKGKLPGMRKESSLWGATTDGRGHLLVCDTENRYIHMLSSSGMYMGAIFTEGEQGLGQPWRIHWCKDEPICFIVHKKEQDWCISMIQDTRSYEVMPSADTVTEDDGCSSEEEILAPEKTFPTKRAMLSNKSGTQSRKRGSSSPDDMGSEDAQFIIPGVASWRRDETSAFLNTVRKIPDDDPWKEPEESTLLEKRRRMSRWNQDEAEEQRDAERSTSTAFMEKLDEDEKRRWNQEGSKIQDQHTAEFMATVDKDSSTAEQVSPTNAASSDTEEKRASSIAKMAPWNRKRSSGEKELSMPIVPYIEDDEEPEDEATTNATTEQEMQETLSPEEQTQTWQQKQQEIPPAFPMEHVKNWQREETVTKVTQQQEMHSMSPAEDPVKTWPQQSPVSKVPQQQNLSPTFPVRQPMKNWQEQKGFPGVPQQQKQIPPLIPIEELLRITTDNFTKPPPPLPTANLPHKNTSMATSPQVGAMQEDSTKNKGVFSPDNMRTFQGVQYPAANFPWNKGNATQLSNEQPPPPPPPPPPANAQGQTSPTQQNDSTVKFTIRSGRPMWHGSVPHGDRLVQQSFRQDSSPEMAAEVDPSAANVPYQEGKQCLNNLPTNSSGLNPHSATAHTQPFSKEKGDNNVIEDVSKKRGLLPTPGTMGVNMGVVPPPAFFLRGRGFPRMRGGFPGMRGRGFPRMRGRSYRRRRTSVSEFNFRVTGSIRTSHTSVSDMCVLPDGNVVLCAAAERDSYRLVLHNMETGRELRTAHLTTEPGGLAPVTLGGVSCVAVSYSSERQREIVFHDVVDLSVIVLKYSVAQGRPSRLCTVSSTTLLYIDDSKIPREVRWLDCTTSPPRPTSGRHITHTQDDVIGDLCCVEHPNKQLLVTVHKSTGINAYNTSSNKREWCVSGQLNEGDDNLCPRRVATDGSGHLFVIDSGNDCLQMFSTDSVYMGRLLREERCFGKLSKIDWCSKTSSVVVFHKRNRKYEISKIQESPATPESDVIDSSDESPTRQEAESPRSRHSFSSRSAQSVRSDGDDGDTDVQDERDYGSLPEESEDDAVLQEPPRKKSLWDVSPRIPKVSDFNAKVIQSIMTYETQVICLSAGGANSVIICGNNSQDDRWTLIKYSIQDGRKLNVTKLPSRPESMVDVTLAGKRCLALSFIRDRTIEFRYVNNLGRRVHYESVKPHRPGRLCMAGPSTLLYENLSKSSGEVRWLDCSTSHLKSASGIKVTHTQQESIRDMCTVQYKGKLLLITTSGTDGIFAYNTKADKLSWRVGGNKGRNLVGSREPIGADAVTTDGHSRIFVSDYNNKCVQMFSLDGTHLKSVLRKHKTSRADPLRMRWYNGISSLIVTYVKKNFYDINILLEETEDESSSTSRESSVERKTRGKPRRR